MHSCLPGEIGIGTGLESGQTLGFALGDDRGEFGPVDGGLGDAAGHGHSIVRINNNEEKQQTKVNTALYLYEKSLIGEQPHSASQQQLQKSFRTAENIPIEWGKSFPETFWCFNSEFQRFRRSPSP